MPRPRASPCICGSAGYARGMCRSHYEKVMRSLRENPPPWPPRRHVRKDKNPQGCCETGCTREFHAKGRCAPHYQAWKRSFLPPRPPRPLFYNPLVPKVEEMALTMDPSMIVRALGITKGVVAGIIDRARMMGRLPPGKSTRKRVGGTRAFWARIMATPDHVPTPDRFPVRGGCLYMEGDPKNPAATFCGRPVFIFGEAWCVSHRQLVYKPRLDLSNLAPEQIRVLAIPEAAD